MPWIESHTDLRGHPKLINLTNRLGISQAQGVGHLHLLWWWVLTYRWDGVLTGLSPNDIASAAGWKSDPKKLVSALIDCGFIDRKGRVLTIHNWLDYAGAMVKMRMLRKVRTGYNKLSPTTTPNLTEPTKPGQPPIGHFLANANLEEIKETLRAIGLTNKSIVAVCCHGKDKIAKAINLSEGKKNPAGFILDALDKGWV